MAVPLHLDPSLASYKRLCWVNLYHTPLHLWGDDFFNKVLIQFGTPVCFHPITSKKKRLDVAKALISTSYLETIDCSTNIFIGDKSFKIKITEDCSFGWVEDEQTFNCEDSEDTSEEVRSINSVAQLPGNHTHESHPTNVSHKNSTTEVGSMAQTSGNKKLLEQPKPLTLPTCPIPTTQLSPCLTDPNPIIAPSVQPLGPSFVNFSPAPLPTCTQILECHHPSIVNTNASHSSATVIPTPSRKAKSDSSLAFPFSKLKFITFRKSGRKPRKMKQVQPNGSLKSTSRQTNISFSSDEFIASAPPDAGLLPKTIQDDREAEEPVLENADQQILQKGTPSPHKMDGAIEGTKELLETTAIEERNTIFQMIRELDLGLLTSEEEILKSIAGKIGAEIKEWQLRKGM